MKQSIRPLENVFSIVSLLLFSQGFYTVILGGAIGGEEGEVDSVLLRLAFLGIYAISFALLAFRSQRTLSFLKTNLWLLFLIGLAIFSVSWSSIPEIALRKVISMIGTTFFAVYLASRYSFEQQLKIYSWTFGIAVLFSFLFALALPEYGISSLDAVSGAWRGIYPHKSGLGQSMFISFLTFYFLSISSKKNQLLFRIFCLLSVVLIVFAESATSLVSVVFIFAIAQGLNHLSLKSKKSVLLVLLFIIFSALLLFIIVINFNAFLAANNKDITLTGRTPLWADLWGFIEQKPWLGYGYGTFFSSLHRETDLLWKVHRWNPVHAHNGYIQLWLHLGIVGLSVFMLGYVRCLFNSLFKYLISKDIKMLWVFLFLIYAVTLNLTEVSFFAAQGIVWIISLVAIYSMKPTSQNSPHIS
ncbi:MAG: O-antigen ligase family protein [Waterburya sp.]